MSLTECYFSFTLASSACTEDEKFRCPNGCLVKSLRQRCKLLVSRQNICIKNLTLAFLRILLPVHFAEGRERPNHKNRLKAAAEWSLIWKLGDDC